MCRFVSDWVYGGIFRDVYKEFMIEVNEDYLTYRGEHVQQESRNGWVDCMLLSMCQM